MSASVYALAPDALLRSVRASRDTLGRTPVRVIEVVDDFRSLTEDAPYAVIGGLAQILWARKTHTDDLDMALASDQLARAAERVRRRQAGPGWRLPKAPDRPHEENEVFEVWHLHFRGSVVDLIAFRDADFMAEILGTTRAVPELSGMRFIRPELLLVTHLLRPGAPSSINRAGRATSSRGSRASRRGSNRECSRSARCG